MINNAKIYNNLKKTKSRFFVFRYSFFLVNQTPFHFFYIFSRWQIFGNDAALGQHLTNSGIVIHMLLSDGCFALKVFGWDKALYAMLRHVLRSPSQQRSIKKWFPMTGFVAANSDNETTFFQFSETTLNGSFRNSYLDCIFCIIKCAVLHIWCAPPS